MATLPCLCVAHNRFDVYLIGKSIDYLNNRLTLFIFVSDKMKLQKFTQQHGLITNDSPNSLMHSMRHRESSKMLGAYKNKQDTNIMVMQRCDLRLDRTHMIVCKTEKTNQFHNTCYDR